MCLNSTIEEKSIIFEKNLLATNRGFNFYVNWNNVTGLDKYIIELHSLDSLIGKKQEFDMLFIELLKKCPSVVKTFPYLFALSKAERKNLSKKNSILEVVGTEIDSEDLQQYSFYPDEKFSNEQINSYLKFFKQMGLKNLFQNIIERSTLDYITGVLVGLDSNGRKNRGGTAFELACEPIIRDICNEYGITVITQKQFKVLKKKGFNISKDIESRKADFILIKGEKCLNIEVNFFGGAGSKPEEIIDSYINRQADLQNSNIKFCLITDGKCWKGTTNQLQKGFRHLKYLINYRMAKTGILKEIIKTIFDT